MSGPRPDLDPDVVAALDDALDLNDPDNILDDDFVIKVVMTCHCNLYLSELNNTLYKNYRE